MQGLDLEPLKADLEGYFGDENKKPDYLGKDVRYSRPEGIEDSELHHVHIYVDGVSCKDTWKYSKTSNSYIVYTFGFFEEDHYHVVAFLDEKAHEKCRNDSFMRDLKKVADNFRDQH